LHVLSLRALVLVAVAILITACASAPGPQATTSWRDPDFRGPPFRKIFVIGLSAQSLTDQRGFENLMVSALTSAGVEAVPGWQFVPTDRTPDQATMRAAVAQSRMPPCSCAYRAATQTLGYGVGGTASVLMASAGTSPASPRPAINPR
jgi:hypothetical protein